MLDFRPANEFFGRQLRFLSSLLEDDFIDPNLIAHDVMHEMRRSEASHCRQRKPQRLVAGEPIFKHRRKDGAQGWCGPCVCVLSEEPKPGRNETVWVRMRNCLHKCNRTQVKPATNEEAEGIETVTTLLPSLTETVREGRTRHFADITDEGTSMHLPIPTPHHKVPDQKLTRSPRPRPRHQPALTWRLESVIAGFDFEKKKIRRDITWS